MGREAFWADQTPHPILCHQDLLAVRGAEGISWWVCLPSTHDDGEIPLGMCPWLKTESESSPCWVFRPLALVWADWRSQSIQKLSAKYLTQAEITGALPAISRWLEHL